MNPLRALVNVWGGLKRMASGAHGRDDVLSDFWYSDVAGPVASNVTVTDSTALTYSAVWAATRLLSGTIGSLPLNLYKRTGAQGKAVLRDDPRNALVQYSPNPEMLSMMFRSQGAGQQINAGNCYAEIERDKRGNVVSLWPIHYTRVRLVRDDATKKLFYEVRNNTAEPTYLELNEMLHVPSMISDDGLSGKGVIRHARESIGFGIATEKYGSKWFGSGGVPRAVVTTQKKLTPESRDNFRKEWKEIYGGPEGDRVALLTEGADIKALNVTPEDSQFLATRQHNIEEIARWYGVPPHMLQHLLRATFNNIEHMGIEFVQYSLLPWLVLWEQELDRKLLRPEEQESMFFKFNVMALLRGDAKSRAEYYHQGINDSWLTPNMVLELEDMNPVAGGDVRYIQGAMVALGEDGIPVVPENNTSTTGDAIDAEFEAVDSEGAAVTGDVQATALNGAQIVALVDIANRLATEQLPPEGTRAMLEAAFPLMDKALIETMVSELDKFEPKPIEATTAQNDDTPTPPVKPPDDAATKSTTWVDGQRAACLAAAKVMLSGAVSRMIRKEATAARRAAGKPREFVKWLDEFYGEDHRRNYAESISAPCDALIALGYAVDSGSLAAAEVSRSRGELLELSGNCTATELPTKVETCVSGWEVNRSAEVTATVTAKGADQ